MLFWKTDQLTVDVQQCTLSNIIGSTSIWFQVVTNADEKSQVGNGTEEMAHTPGASDDTQGTGQTGVKIFFICGVFQIVQEGARRLVHVTRRSRQHSQIVTQFKHHICLACPSLIDL